MDEWISEIFYLIMNQWNIWGEKNMEEHIWFSEFYIYMC